MIFPQEIWEIIISHFHSAYKKPSHYEAIIDIPSFNFKRSHHVGINSNNYKGFSPIDCRNDPDRLSLHSYYIDVYIKNKFQKKEEIYQNPIMNLNRSKGKIRKEFDEIINIYENEDFYYKWAYFYYSQQRNIF
tara:strand:- start:2335 stop:2733 length:399 start_codon:yes stop_codon:yes gene_type:complete